MAKANENADLSVSEQKAKLEAIIAENEQLKIDKAEAESLIASQAEAIAKSEKGGAISNRVECEFDGKTYTIAPSGVNMNDVNGNPVNHSPEDIIANEVLLKKLIAMKSTVVELKN
jgi:hypothetical protein